MATLSDDDVRYYEGCDMSTSDRNGTLSSPAFGAAGASGGYPHNQECTYVVRHPDGAGRISMVFTHMDVHPSDVVEVSGNS